MIKSAAKQKTHEGVKKTLAKKSPLLCAAISFFLLLTGCGSKAIDGAEQFAVEVDQIDIPDDVKIIGLGEATHGNIEFQELKKDVFDALMKNENVRVFVLEGDFGGGQQINQFILHGTSSAEETVNALDYDIYRTKQMIELVQWMHDFNLKADEKDKIFFYGSDMQRYDANKEGLLTFYKVVNGNAEKEYAAQLEHASNHAMYQLTVEQLKKLDHTIDNIILDLRSNKAEYEGRTTADAYAFALQYATIMKQRTQLLLNNEEYAKLRDQYLADNLRWISEFEETHGRDKVFISAHNGHIEKTSASVGGKSMGDYLDEGFGSEYFAIGTDFVKSEFQALNRSSDERKKFSLENHNDLVDAFSKIERNIFYVDFQKAGRHEALSNIINKEQRMANIGDDFRSWYKLSRNFYTIKMVPGKAYDGIIIVKEAEATTVIE